MMNTSDISVEERHNWIVQKAMVDGEVLLADIVERFHVTETTGRRDLSTLEQRGILKRVRRGAVPYLQEKRNQSFSTKSKLHLDAKQRIGKAAASIIKPGDIMILDSGTTTIQIVKHIPLALRQNGGVTIMTNSITIVQELLDFNSPNIILLGGLFVPEHQATAGPQTISQLNNLTADYVFLGADGISLETGVTTANVLIAEVDRLMTERARKKVLVIDSSKFSHVGLIPVKPIDVFDLIITDSDAPEEILQKIRDLGVEVMIV